MRRSVAVVAVLCGGLLLTAAGVSTAVDWSMLGGDATHSGYRADPLGLPVSLLWKYGAAGEEAVVTVWSSPAASDDAVFFCYDTSVYGVERATGQLRWRYDAQTQLRSSPAITDEGVFVGGSNGVLYAIAQDTGRLMWRYPTPTRKPMESSPVIDKGTLYVGSDDYYVYAIDLQTRQLKWQFKTTHEVKAAPMVRGGVCYVGAINGDMYAIDDQGRQIWQANLGPGPVFAGPSFERDKILAPAGNRVVALDMDRGIRRWTFDAPGDIVTGSPAVADRMMYVGSKDGSLYGVNASTGRAVWRYPSGTDETTQPILSGPAVCRDTVFARTTNGIILGVDARTGKLRWRYKMLAPVSKAKTTEAERGGGGRGEEGESEEEDRESEEGGWGEDEEGGALYGGGGRFSYYQRGRRTPRDRSAYRAGSTSASIRTRRDPTPGYGGGYGEYLRPQRRWEEAKFDENILSSLAVSGNAVYALGDDGALYALDASAADRDPPQLSEAVLQIPGADRNMYAVALDVVDGREIPGRQAANVQVPGTPPLHVSVKLLDEGSGLDTSSIRVFLDGQPQQGWVFDEKESLLWVTYNPGGISRPLADGQHDVVVEASDYRGQSAVMSMSFLVNNTLPAPTSAKAGKDEDRGGEEEEEQEEDEEEE